MILRREIPPTAGLPMCWRDWLPVGRDISTTVARLFGLTPLQLECSGTAALVVALKTLSAMPANRGRCEVIIPAYSCPLVVLAIAYCGLKPCLCDTVAGGYDFDPHCLEKCAGSSTLAIMPTHLGGRLADVGFCVELARSCGAYVIEDAAQALGAEVGKQGDITFFSLAVGKGLTLYEGGLLTARDADMRQALKHTHAEIVARHPLAEAKRLAELFAYTALYRPCLLYWAYGRRKNAALARGETLAAVGDEFDMNIPVHQVSAYRAQCGANAAQRLPAFLQQTRAQACLRLEQLSRMRGLKVLGSENPQTGTWPFFMVVLADARRRDRILEKLWTAPDGVSRLFIHALGQYEYLRPYLQNQPHTPHASDLASRMLTISNSPWLDAQRFDSLCAVIGQTE